MRHKRELQPFSSKPLIPGRGGGLQYWRQERDIEALHGQITDLTKVIRRLSQEVIDQILFLQSPNHKSPEETHRAISQMAGALKNESSVLKSLFQIGDLHPALERIFMERATPVNELGQSASGTEIVPTSSSPYIPLNQRKPNIFNVLTDRELEILTLTIAGYTAAECAAKTGTEPGTVSVHRQKIKAKAEQFAGEKGKPK